MREFQVLKSDITKTRIAEVDINQSGLEKDEILVQIENFSFTKSLKSVSSKIGFQNSSLSVSFSLTFGSTNSPVDRSIRQYQPLLGLPT